MTPYHLTSHELERIIRQYAAMIFRLAFAYTKKKETADDILQEVSIELIRRQKRFTDEEHLKAWLIRVTINKCHSLNRSKKYRSEIPFDPTEFKDALTPEQREIHPAEDPHELWDRVLMLPNKLSQVLLLYYAEDMTTREIARLLYIRESSVRSRLTRARRSLKNLLENKDPNTPR